MTRIFHQKERGPFLVQVVRDQMKMLDGAFCLSRRNARGLVGAPSGSLGAIIRPNLTQFSPEWAPGFKAIATSGRGLFPMAPDAPKGEQCIGRQGLLGKFVISGGSADY